jgi:hypothetical protein
VAPLHVPLLPASVVDPASVAVAPVDVEVLLELPVLLPVVAPLDIVRVLDALPPAELLPRTLEPPDPACDAVADELDPAEEPPVPFELVELHATRKAANVRPTVIVSTLRKPIIVSLVSAPARQA